MPVMSYGIDPYYFLLVLPAAIFAMIVQFRMTSTFKRYNQVATSSHLTGAQAARMILDANGLQEVAVEQVAGNLTDHYDPGANVIRLSDATYGSASIGAVGVAAHESGHAIQYATNYAPIKLRAAIIPVCSIGSKLSIPIIILGVLLSFGGLVTIGILLFALMVVFQLVTLPVEFNASGRAMKILESSNMMTSEELTGARKVLSAAAMTYVAALISSIASLLRLILLYGRRRSS